MLLNMHSASKKGHLRWPFFESDIYTIIYFVLLRLNLKRIILNLKVSINASRYNLEATKLIPSFRGQAEIKRPIIR